MHGTRRRPRAGTLCPAAGLSWSLVIPVKVLAQAKSRLTGLAGQRRPELALAMAADTDRGGGRAAASSARPGGDRRPGRSPTPRPALAPSSCRTRRRAGLNEALAHGAALLGSHLAGTGPGGAGRRPARARGPRTDRGAGRAGRLGTAFVPDADGTGTRCTRRRRAQFRPEFGPASRDRHLAAGAAEIDLGGQLPRDCGGTWTRR